MSEASGEAVGFHALPHGSLRPYGIVGDQPEVFCVDGDLLLRDAGGEVLDIQPGEVERLRLGMMATKSQVYHVARLFLRREGKPLLLMPKTPRCPHYAATMRAFAHAVARERGLDHLEHGLTRGSALAMFLVVLVICTGASLMALLVWSEEFGMVGAVVFTAAMAGAVALAGWEALKREMPKRMVSLEEIERYLPQPR